MKIKVKLDIERFKTAMGKVKRTAGPLIKPGNGAVGVVAAFTPSIRPNSMAQIRANKEVSRLTTQIKPTIDQSDQS